MGEEHSLSAIDDTPWKDAARNDDVALELRAHFDHDLIDPKG